MCPKNYCLKNLFWAEDNEQLKNHYRQSLPDPYYAAIAHSALQTPMDMKSIVQLSCHLAMIVGVCERPGNLSIQSVAVDVSSSQISWEPEEIKQSEKCWQ